MTPRTLALIFFLWNSDRAMNPVLRGGEDLPQDYFSGFHKETLIRRQARNSISRDKTGNRKSWFNIITEHAGKEAADFVAGEGYFPLCNHLWVFPGAIPVFSGEENTLCRVVTTLLPQSPRLNPRPVHMENLVDKVEIGEVFLRDFRFNPLITIPPTLHSHSLICPRRYTVFAIDSLVNCRI
jgi:hypothetical protein